MPIRHAVMHFIDKKPDGSPAVLSLASSELPDSAAIDNLLFEVNGTYNAKTGKGWGFFHPVSGAYPVSGWLGKVMIDDVPRLHQDRGGAPDQADGGVEPVGRRPRPVRPIHPGHD
ncbi:MAG: hypothetical protein J7573_22260 [Pseudomonas sp.]|nr:hypothetical protein [Pseudomonas sp.]